MAAEDSKQEADSKVLIIPTIPSHNDDVIIILHHTHSQDFMTHMQLSRQASQEDNWAAFKYTFASMLSESKTLQQKKGHIEKNYSVKNPCCKKVNYQLI